MKLQSTHFSDLTADSLYSILQLRSRVFLLEQGIICLDMDDLDRNSFHISIEEDGRILGYLRVFRSGSKAVIGRVAVDQSCRGRHFGTLLMEEGIRTAQRHFPGLPIHLHSQQQVVGFYEKLGFRTCSDMFLEEGVPHYEMVYQPVTTI